MVDALHRAHHLAAPNGFVVDLHPLALAVVEVGNEVFGAVQAGEAAQRHAAADAALVEVIDTGLFALERSLAFTFYTYGDTIEELRDYVVEHWQSGRIDDETVARAGAVLRRVPGVKPRIHEQVHVAKLRPLR